jgi:hypothetical protein
MPAVRFGIISSLVLSLVACAETPAGLDTLSGNNPALDHGPAELTVAMHGLNSPRGMAWGPEGGLYVAEGGRPTATALCATVARGQNCYSGTGSVTRLWKGRQERVARELPSVYNAVFNDIIGPQDIGFQGRRGMYVSIGWGGDPAARSQLGSLGTPFGSLLVVRPSGHWRIAADIAGYEGAHNPAGGPVDANPFGLLAEVRVRVRTLGIEPEDRHHVAKRREEERAGGQFVADAGANALLHVASNGAVSLVAVFPATAVPPGPFNPPFAFSDAVPTEVQRGPDGALYVSMLTGAPFLPGAAAIYRVVPGQAPQPYAVGFTQITDFDWAADGSLYVVQHGSGPFFAPPGSLVRVAPNGARTVITTALVNPTGVLAAPDGAVYVSHKVHVPGGGEVLRIVP